MELRCYSLPQAITSIADMRLFMEHHVFAVWDFMLLLKTLQQHLAPSGVPWVPPTHPEIAGLVNSLVAEEECDLLPENLGGTSASLPFLDLQASDGGDRCEHCGDRCSAPAGLER